MLFRGAYSWRESVWRSTELWQEGEGTLCHWDCRCTLTRATVLESPIWSQETFEKQGSWLWICTQCFNPEMLSPTELKPITMVHPCPPPFLNSFLSLLMCYKWPDWLHGVRAALGNRDNTQRSSFLSLLPSQSNCRMLQNRNFAQEQMKSDTVLLKSTLDVLFWTLNSQGMINCT